MKKYFIITIDTEGDNLWTPVMRSYGAREITTDNAFYVERFQKLCEKYGFVPTYLVNHEMANAEPFVVQASEWVKDKKCEIGMHMHAWNTPPIHELKYRRESNNPYAGDYPHKVMWEKLYYLTNEIEEKFGVLPTSHRGGRWYVDPWYVQALLKLGYVVDCSVTPGVTWAEHIGYKVYGCDYRKYPNEPYMMNGKKLNKKRSIGLLEIPPTISNISIKMMLNEIKDNPRDFKEIISRKIWLRPNGKNLEELLHLADSNDNYLEFMLHSSELMAGGSPTFKTDGSIEKLYKDMEILFEKIADTRTGIGLTDYANIIRRQI